MWKDRLLIAACTGKTCELPYRGRGTKKESRNHMFKPFFYVQWLMRHRFLKQRGFKILLPYKDRHSYSSLLWRGKLWINNLALPCWRSYVASLLFIGGVERKPWYFLSLSWTTQKASYGFLLSYFIEWVRAFLFYKGNITLLRKYFLSEFIPLLLSHIISMLFGLLSSFRTLVRTLIKLRREFKVERMLKLSSTL